MSRETAYRTADEAVLTAWREWQDGQRAIAAKRLVLVEILGRNAYVNRDIGFGFTRIVGFERLPGDVDGDLITPYQTYPGGLVVSSTRGAHGGRVVPNLRRKAGKDFEKYLHHYVSPALYLPGMATFHVYGTDRGLVMGGPGLWEWDGVLYAYWECDDAPHEDMWEQIPLSTYYLAKEAYDADQD